VGTALVIGGIGLVNRRPGVLAASGQGQATIAAET